MNTLKLTLIVCLATLSVQCQGYTFCKKTKRDRKDRRKLSITEHTSSKNKKTPLISSGKSKVQRQLQDLVYTHTVHTISPSSVIYQDEYDFQAAFFDVENGDTVELQPGHYILNDHICPESGVSPHPSYTIKGLGASPSDTVIYGAKFKCFSNQIVMENLEIWGAVGETCNNDPPFYFDLGSGLIFRNSIVNVFGGSNGNNEGNGFDLWEEHKVHFINSELHNRLPGQLQGHGIINRARNPLVVMNSKLTGFDAAIYFYDIDDPDLEPGPYNILSKNEFENNCEDCAVSCDGDEYHTSCEEGCPAWASSFPAPNTPEGVGIEVLTMIDILFDDNFPTTLPVKSVEYFKVTKEGETVAYRVPSGYSMLPMPTGYAPVYTDFAHAYQFDTTAKYKKKVKITFERPMIFGMDCDSVEFFYYKNGMEGWQSLADYTQTTSVLYKVTLKKNLGFNIKGAVVAAFIPEVSVGCL